MIKALEAKRKKISWKKNRMQNVSLQTSMKDITIQKSLEELNHLSSHFITGLVPLLQPM